MKYQLTTSVTTEDCLFPCGAIVTAGDANAAPESKDSVGVMERSLLEAFVKAGEQYVREYAEPTKSKATKAATATRSQAGVETAEDRPV